MIVSPRVVHFGATEIDLRGVGWTADFRPDESGDDRYVTLVIGTHVLGNPQVLGEKVAVRMSRSGAAVLAAASASLPPLRGVPAMLHGRVSEQQDFAIRADLLLDSLNEEA